MEKSSLSLPESFHSAVKMMCTLSEKKMNYQSHSVVSCGNYNNDYPERHAIAAITCGSMGYRP